MLRVVWWLAVAWAAGCGVVALWYVLDLPDPGEVGGEVLCYAVILIVVGRYVGASLGDSWQELLPLRPVRMSLVIPVTLFAMGGYVLSSQLVRLCLALNLLPPEVTDLAAGGAGDSGVSADPSLFRALVSTAVVPAIFEEAIYRGAVLRGLAATMSKRRAIAISALLFASCHFRIERMPDTFLLGLAFGWMATRTGSLWPGMLSHALHNSVVLLVVRGLIPTAGIEMDTYGLLPAVLVWGAIAIMLVGLTAFRRDTAPPRRARIAPLWFGSGDAPVPRLAAAPVPRLQLR